jgi:hypothetical protein
MCPFKHITKKHSQPTYAVFEYFRPRIAFLGAFSTEFSERECFWEQPTYAFFSRQELLLVTERQRNSMIKLHPSGQPPLSCTAYTSEHTRRCEREHHIRHKSGFPAPEHAHNHSEHRKEEQNENDQPLSPVKQLHAARMAAL